MNLDLDTYPSVAQLAEEVKAISGKGIEFVMQPLGDGVLGSQRTARGEFTHHLVILNEKYADIRHSIASFQMRFILGRCKIKAIERDVTSTESAGSEIFAASQAKVGVQAARKLADMIVSGIVVQLMSVPTGLRAHLAIRKLQPELEMQHRRAMTILAQNNLRNLNPPNLPVPSKVIKWNKALISIENTGISSLCGDPALMGPLKLMGLQEEAERLVLPLLAGAHDQLDDRELIDLTAKHIGMNGYHRWVKA
jgi:hypothetical protein